ncbi:hypothetical protein B0H10DRAFT_897137 [Mycena sp. CBHHK59/15]|nr:hypothetical protein B0H10DRAFT_897137 [Mycena sp. CBHHK59/15]
MDASIGEPFLLASYAVTQRLQKSMNTGESERVANLCATHEKIASGSSDGYVTVTAQGDGVHVLDLSTLHPVISHTLGPSTGFSCPSVTLGVLEGDQNIYSTYSAIASSSDVTQDDCGRTIWLWRENISSTIGDRASQKKKAAVMPHQISGIYACHNFPHQLLVLSPVGDMTVIDADLEIQSTMAPPSGTRAVLWTFVFPRESCSFLPGSSRGTAIVLLEFSKDATFIRILGVSGGNEASEIGSSEIPLRPDQIASISCSPSGYLSIMTRDGSWQSFLVESQNDAISVYPIAEPLHLRSLSFIGRNTEVSLIAVNTSLVLLTAITTSPARNVVLLLWDLQYSVLLASHVLAIPSTLSHLPQISMTLRLVESASPQALLVLSPTPTDAQAKSARSSVLVVPLAVPQMSTISNAMGRASAGAQWLVPSPAADTLEPPRRKVLTAVQAAMLKNEPEKAEKAFFEWEKREQQQSGEDGNSAEQPVALGHSFVRDLLAAVLQPAKLPLNTPYSAALVRYLLERRVVSASMVEDGLLAALKLRGDWNAIELCMTHVIDLAESDLMFILQFVADHSRKNDSEDAMQVDPLALGSVPQLHTFLGACARYQTSPAMLRVAIHQHLTQPEDVVVVLEALEEWVGQWRGAEVIALPSKKSVAKNEQGVVVLKDGWQKDDGNVHPPLIKVLSLIQTVLDASFLALLQHTPAHRVLRKVLARIEPEIGLTEQVEPLRAH